MSRCKDDEEELRNKILAEVMDHMKWDSTKAGYWYKTPNPNFGFCSPKLLVQKGRGHKVLEFIAAQRYLGGTSANKPSSFNQPGRNKNTRT
jgi:hypothetical protein